MSTYSTGIKIDRSERAGHVSAGSRSLGRRLLRGTGRNRRGFTLVELAIVLAVIGIVASMAIPATSRLSDNRRLYSSVDTLGWAFSYARGEAQRSGNLHIVYVRTDAQGNDLFDSPGHQVDILILDDGRPGGPNQNCQIDAGEPVVGRSLEESVTFGLSDAGAKVGSDGGGGDATTGATFVTAGGGQANWVVFRPEGLPIPFSADCSMGELGDGAGGVYLTNGVRDASMVLSPLGATRVHVYRPAAGSWSS